MDDDYVYKKLAKIDGLSWKNESAIKWIKSDYERLEEITENLRTRYLALQREFNSKYWELSSKYNALERELIKLKER